MILALPIAEEAEEVVEAYAEDSYVLLYFVPVAVSLVVMSVRYVAVLRIQRTL